MINSSPTSRPSRFVSAAICVSILAGGCTSTGSPIDDLANADVATGALVGVLLGAGLGYVIDKYVADGDGKTGLVIGAVVGVGTGAIIGHVAAKRRTQYASDQEFLEDEISKANDAISAKEAEIARAEADTEVSRAKVAALQAKHASNQNVATEIQVQLAQINRTIEINNGVLRNYVDTIEYLDTITRDTNIAAAGTEEERAELVALTRSANERKATLTDQYNRLTTVQRSNEQMAESLVAMLK